MTNAYLLDQPTALRDTPRQEERKLAKRISLAKAAKEIGCSADTLRHAIERGELSATKPGRDWMVYLLDAQTWWQRPKHPGGRPKRGT